MKKQLFVLLALVATMGTASAYDFSAVSTSGHTLYYTINGSNVTVVPENSGSPRYTTAPTGNLVIPSTVTANGTTYSVTTIGDYAFSGCSGLASVTIPNSVTSIGSYAFRGCSGLASVTIPNSVTSIGSYAFYQCSGLASVTIPNSVTSIGISAFYECSGLASLIIGNAVTTIGGYAFYSCTGLTSVTIPNSVTIIGEYAFSYCLGLTSLTIGNAVTSIGDCAFRECTRLTSITIPNSVTSIGANSFTICPKLASMTVAAGNTRYDSRNNCNAIIQTDNNTLIAGCQTTVIPNSVTTIGQYAFYGSGLTSITIPSSVTAIGSNAFAYDYRGDRLREITCLAPTAPTAPANAFNNQSSTIPVYIPCGSQSSYASTWTFFSNFVETTGYAVTAQSADATMGSATITTRPTCTNATAVVTATANRGYRFTRWNDGNTDNPRTLNVTQDITLTAYFEMYGCRDSGSVFSAVTPSGHTLYYRITAGCNAEVTYQYYNNSNNYSALSGALVIPDNVTYNGITYAVTSIGTYAFAHCTGLTSVTIPNSITSIGENAFRNCRGLTSVTIPNSVTSIGIDAFSDCSRLTSVTIPNSVTSIGGSAFQNCSGLTSITIPNSVTSIGFQAFYNCTGLTSLTIPNSVTSIGDLAFYGCDNITFLNYNCNYNILNSISKSNLQTVIVGDSVSSIPENWFSGCTRLNTITIGRSVTYIGVSAFYNCSQLTTVNFNADSCGYMGYISGNSLYMAFGSSASNLATLNIGSNVKAIPDYAFAYCRELQNVNLPTTLKYIGRYAFAKTKISGNLTIGNNVRAIGYAAFWDCDNLTSVVLPNSVTTIDTAVFNNCSGLTSVTIPNSVTSIGGNAFSSCSGLTSVTIPNSVTSIEGNAFFSCSGLTSVTIPNSVTSIGGFAFAGCSGLNSITVDAGNTHYDSRGNCNALIETGSNALITGCCNTVIPTTVTSIRSGAFYNCVRLDSIVIPDAVTSIGSYAFQNCQRMASVTISNALREIESETFRGCSALTSVTIPNSVTSIAQHAFYGCSGLTEVTIGSAVTSIADSAFSRCNNIAEITSLARVAPTLQPSTISSISSTIPINVPCGSTNSYYSRWSYFSNFIEDGTFTVTATSADEQMGSAMILNKPDCANPIAQICATANNGFRFDHWNDNNTDNPRTVRLTSDTGFVAIFDTNSMHTVTATLCLGAGEYQHGATATVMAAPQPNMRFTGWADGITDNPRNITVVSDTTLTPLYSHLGTDTVFVHDTTAITHYVYDTVRMYDTLTVMTIDTVHHYHYDTTRVCDTLTIVHFDTLNHYMVVSIDTVHHYNFQYDTTRVFDTLMVLNIDTLHHYYYDTTRVFDTLTVVNIDTVHHYNFQYDTTRIMDTLVLITVDTTHQYHFDTIVSIRTEHRHDTTVVYDTLRIVRIDTVHHYFYAYHTVDTLFQYVYDTTERVHVISDTVYSTHYIYTYDTVYIYDTIYMNSNGIDGAAPANMKVYTTRAEIVVEGTEGMAVQLYDISGRLLDRRDEGEDRVKFLAPASGTYVLRIGDRTVRKVVVIR